MGTFLISSERFVDLFITLKQLQYLGNNKDVNLYNLTWDFNAKLLSEFIFHSKRDYRYRDFLECFDFTDDFHSLNLISALNRAVQKHLLTGIYEDRAYISRYYTNFRVMEDNSEFSAIMREFIEDFDYFCLDKELYLKNAGAFMNEELQGVGDNTRMIFDLQRRVVRKYEEQGEN